LNTGQSMPPPSDSHASYDGNARSPEQSLRKENDGDPIIEPLPYSPRLDEEGVDSGSPMRKRKRDPPP